MDQAEQLRNVIKVHNQNNMNTARVVAVTSGKGGGGKSYLSVNLAACLRKAGKRVIIFDADFGLANIEIMFGAIPKYNLSDVIYHGKSIQEIITQGPLEIGFISGGSGIVSLNGLQPEQIKYLVKSINELKQNKEIFELCILKLYELDNFSQANISAILQTNPTKVSKTVRF